MWHKVSLSLKFMIIHDVASQLPFQRFSTAVADINGTLYVVGGYDGIDYLK